MYSRIPMPRVEWSEKSMRWAMGFFPLVGAVIGAAVYGAARLVWFLELQPVFCAAILTVLPVLLTGGIHLDGYLDTVDALSSCQPRERKLEILKDSHAGAFAVLFGGVYLLAYAGAVSQLSMRTLPVFCLAFPLIRACSAMSVLRFRSAREGSAAAFQRASAKGALTAVSVLWMALAIAAMAVLDWVLALVAAGCVGLVFVWYGVMAYRKFGGVTGDLAGWFLQVCECVTLYGLVAAEVISAWI